MDNHFDYGGRTTNNGTGFETVSRFCPVPGFDGATPNEAPKYGAAATLGECTPVMEG